MNNNIKKVESLEKNADVYLITVELLLQVASECFNLYVGSEVEEKREIIALLFSNLLLNCRKLEYTVEKPFDSIFKNREQLAWGQCIDSILKAVYERVRVMKSVIYTEKVIFLNQ